MCFRPLFRLPDYLVPPKYKKRIRNKGVCFDIKEFESLKLIYGFTDRDFSIIPCGQCGECRLAYRRSWALRCMHEAQATTDNYFLTLTYDDLHVPISDTIDVESGEFELSTRKSDFQSFMKNLRRHFDYHYSLQDVRFYACAEYGELFDRPHYHAIIYNLPLPDKKIVDHNELGQPVYFSQTLQDIWKKGNVYFTDVTFDTCSYVAGYVAKKLNGKKLKERYKTKRLKVRDTFVTYDDAEQLDLFKEAFAREEPWCLMSRRPGIGSDWLREHAEEVYKTDSIIYEKSGKAFKIKPPRYYDNIYDRDIVQPSYKLERETVEELFGKDAICLEGGSYRSIEEIKSLRSERAADALEKKLSDAHRTLEEDLAISERTFKARQEKYEAKKLRRKLAKLGRLDKYRGIIKGCDP